MVVKLPVEAEIVRIAAPKIQIGFIPDLEIPLANFVNSVAFDQVFGELRDQRIPPIPVFWW